MTFHNIRFPTEISIGSTGGPERRTDIVVLGSGQEERNSRWYDSKRRYNAGYGIKSLHDIYDVLEFFEERRGRLYGFLWRDRLDHKSCQPENDVSPVDQFIATADGINWTFQLIKRYGKSRAPYYRQIRKPVEGTVRVAFDSMEMIEGEDFSVDCSTGVLTFLHNTPPSAGIIITAGFEFDVPVRFDSDRLEIDLVKFDAGLIQDIPIVEIKL